MRNAKFRGFQASDYSTISKRQKNAILVTCAAAIFSAALSVIIQFVYLPLGVDGALYSYPSLSLSRGGDPGESQLSVEELNNIEGVKATWGYDVSRTVRVLPMSWWFRIFGANIWAVKALGLLEMIFLFGSMYFVLQGASRDREIALLLWAIYLTDSMVLCLSTELRPDIMVTILTLIVFMLVNTRFEDKTNHILIFFSAFLSMLLLAMTHITAYSAQIGHQFRSIPATCSRLNRPPNRSEATLVFLLLFRFVFLSQGRSYFSHGFSF